MTAGLHKGEGMEIKDRAEKRIREISIDGCPEIGRGAHGVVYRTAPDMLVKVYYENVQMDAIRRERELARWAFVKGIPTAIPFDIVRVGDRYGTVFELLNAGSSSDYVKESPEHLDRFIRKGVELMKQVHAIEAKPGELPDMKQNTMGWMTGMKKRLPEEYYFKLSEIVNAIPDRNTILHADFHLKNIMIIDDELMLIDMDTLCTGDPIFELATIYASYRQFPSLDKKALEMLEIDAETAETICDRTYELYLEGADEAAIREKKRIARILCCIRIIDFLGRHTELPGWEQCIDRCVSDVMTLLQEQNEME